MFYWSFLLHAGLVDVTVATVHFKSVHCKGDQTWC